MLRQQYNPKTWGQQISKNMQAVGYNRVGKHLIFTISTMTASDAMWPTLPRIALNDRYNDRLALLREHVSDLDDTT